MGQKLFYAILGAILIAGTFFIYRQRGAPAPTSSPANIVISPADTSGFRGYFLGDSTAPLEVTEYSDFQCPGCQQFALTQFSDVEQRLIKTGKIRFRYRDFPIYEKHRNARSSAHAAACAAGQGKFWEMAHELFTHQEEWSELPNPTSLFRRSATEIGIDADKWSACMDAGTYAGRIQASRLEGEEVGFPSTPAFVIGGRFYTGMTAEYMVQLVDSLSKAKPVTQR